MSLLLTGGYRGDVQFYVELTNQGDVILRTDLMADPEAAEAALAAVALGFEPEPWLARAQDDMERPLFWLMTEDLLMGTALTHWALAVMDNIVQTGAITLGDKSQKVFEEVRDRARKLAFLPMGDALLEQRMPLFFMASERHDNCEFMNLTHDPRYAFWGAMVMIIGYIGYRFDEDKTEWEELDEFHYELLSLIGDSAGIDDVADDSPLPEADKCRRWLLAQAVRLIESQETSVR